jgi:stage II sporulation protein M
MDRMQFWLEMGQDNPQVVILAAVQNIRVLLAATILGIFTFGVVGLVLIMIPFAIYGFIMGQVMLSGLSPLPFIMAILPHGVVEIPAILIAGAAAVRLGSIVTRPPKDLTVGEAWLRALGDAIKVGIGVVLPLLVIAAMLEVWVTPQVVQFVLTH